MTIIKDDALTGEVRALVDVARENGDDVDGSLAFALTLVDALGLPDDTQFFPAAYAAMREIPLSDFSERTYEIALAAGQGRVVHI